MPYRVSGRICVNERQVIDSGGLPVRICATNGGTRRLVWGVCQWAGAAGDFYPWWLVIFSFFALTAGVLNVAGLLPLAQGFDITGRAVTQPAVELCLVFELLTAPARDDDETGVDL